MSLPTSGAISLSLIRDVLAPGNAAALALGYYIGRTYSVSGGGQRTIPDSPSFSHFHGLMLASVTLSLTDVSGGGMPGGTHVTGFVTATGLPSGGSYAWRRVWGSPAITPTNPSLQTTAFSAFVGAGDFFVSQFVCDYTTGSTTITSDILTATINDTFT